MSVTQIVTGDIWANKTVRQIIMEAKSRIYCVAYVTRYLPWMFGDGDIILCDASRNAVAAGETDPHVLRQILKKGARIYSLPALHVKCAILGEHSLVGSANLSESSARVLTEVAVLRKDVLQASRLKHFVEGLVQLDDVRMIDANAISALEKIPQRKGGSWQNRFVSVRKEKRHMTIMRNWLLSVRDFKRNPPVDVERQVDERIAQLERCMKNSLWEDAEIFWYQTSNGRTAKMMKPNDGVIMVDHGHYEDQERADVFAPGIVLKVERQGQKRFIVYYTRGSSHISLRAFRRQQRVREALPNGFSKYPDRMLTDTQMNLLAAVFN